MTLIQIFISLLSGLYFVGDSPEIAAISYIEQYKDLAIIEMHRSGVPASITLAQALIETNAGRSDLAVKANNHFGIKCIVHIRAVYGQAGNALCIDF